MKDENKDPALLVAELKAGRHLSLYIKTGNGLHIWQAYKEFRRLGLPVPEVILKKFDEYASGVLSADKPDEALKALDLGKNKGGGPWKKKQRLASENQKYIVDRVVALKHAYDDLKDVDVFNKISSETGIPCKKIKKIYYEWLRAAKKRQITAEDIVKKSWR